MSRVKSSQPIKLDYSRIPTVEIIDIECWGGRVVPRFYTDGRSSLQSHSKGGRSVGHSLVHPPPGARAEPGATETENRPSGQKHPPYAI